jgi:hypothetical protein
VVVDAVCEALVEGGLHAHVKGAAERARYVVGVKDNGSGVWRWARKYGARKCSSSSFVVGYETCIYSGFRVLSWKLCWSG